MHYFAGCVIPKGVSYQHAGPYVAKILAPFDENNEGTIKPVWDWYQIGGRWTGVWDEYDPMQDPRNIDGKRAVWPTQFVPYENDLKPVSLFLDTPSVFRRPMTLFTLEGVTEREPWLGDKFGRHTDEEWEEKVQKVLANYRDHQIIVVDYHD